jgi:KDO2-lipid IV(A) lauroyltransferase
MGRDLGEAGAGLDLERVTADHYRMRADRNWLRARSIHRRLRRLPRIEIDGGERIREALARGRGAILWRMSFGSTTWLQAACWQAGLPLVQLSHEEHGATSRGAIGYGVNRRLYVRAESDYLKERVEVQEDGKLFGYMKVLIRRLEDENALVAIRGELRSRQRVPATLFGDRTMFANGAPSLAWLTGATLLTVYAVRDGPFRFRAVIDPPIDVDRERPRRDAAAAAVQEFAARLEERIRAHPSEWMGWYDRLGTEHLRDHRSDGELADGP